MAPDRPSDVVRPRDGRVAIAYFALYLVYLFLRPENEALHWVTLVAVPFLIALLSLPRDRRSVSVAAASVGLRRNTLMAGLGWALALGALLTVFQAFWGDHAEGIRALVRSGRAVWLFPLAFLLMMALAGFTEELFFRGFLQTRLEALTRSPWAAVLLTAPLFGLYHLPYAYLNPGWPSHGDWGDAWTAALVQGVPGGLILGALYVVSRGNLLACVVLHSLINAAPVMTMIRLGG